MKRTPMIVLPLVVLALGAITAGLLFKFGRKVESKPVEVLPPLVNVVRAQLQNHSFAVRAQGTVAPRTEIDLVPEISGRIVAVSPSLSAGGFFEKDEMLLALDPRDSELAATAAQARVAEAEVRVSRELAEAELAREEWQSLGSGEPSPLLLRQPQLAEARAALESARAALEQARRDLERTQIKAPFAGRVSDKRADVGQFINRGTPVARLYAVDYAEIRLPLPLEELAYLDLPLHYRGEDRRSGPEVRLFANIAGRVQEWSGRIVRTEGEIDTRTRMLFAVARVEDPYARGADAARAPLMAGMFVHAEITGRTAQSVVVLPRMALRGENTVLVVDEADRLRIRKVEVMRSDRDRVVLRAGVADGEWICLSALETVVEGMKVRVASPPEKGPAQ